METADPTLRFVINCILHIAILFTILSVFFIYYISHIEEKAYQKEVDDLVNHEIKPTLDNLPPQNKAVIHNILRPIPFEIIELPYQTTSKYVLFNNKWLKIQIWLVVAFLFSILVSLLLLYYLRCPGKLDFIGVLVENALIFMFVGCIEIGFFIYIAAKYIPVKPSLMTDVFIKGVKDKLG